MTFDRTGSRTVSLIAAGLAPGAELTLAPHDGPAPAAPAIEIAAEDGCLVIANGKLAVRVPADAQLEQPFAGPIMAMRASRARSGFRRRS